MLSIPKLIGFLSFRIVLERMVILALQKKLSNLYHFPVLHILHFDEIQSHEWIQRLFRVSFMLNKNAYIAFNCCLMY